MTKPEARKVALTKLVVGVVWASTGVRYRLTNGVGHQGLLDGLAASWLSDWMDGLAGLLADLRRDIDAELVFRQMRERRWQPMHNAMLERSERGEIGE